VLAVALENLAKAIAPVLCHMAEDIWQYLPYKTPYKSVFEAGWVKLDEQWKDFKLGSHWTTRRNSRAEVNKLLDQARAEKMIGSSLEAKVLLYIIDKEKWPEVRQRLESLNPHDSLSGNRVDEFRYLFLVSQVEIVDSPEAIQNAQYKAQTPTLLIGVVKADGEKCDRCWNYSTLVGKILEHPTICERCNAALAGQF
jgi:isoleucyl-tRNA synthetase